MSDNASLPSRQARVPDAAAGRRFDAVLAELFPEFSRSRLSEWIKSGAALLDGVPARPRDPVRGGELAILNATLDTETDAIPEDIPLSVLYEDEHVFVIDKPAGLVVHPGAGNPTGTLVNALLFRDPSLASVPRAGVVHRLDKDTSGLLLVAKNDQSQLALSRQLQERQMEKHYRALVEGNLREDSGRIDQPIARSKKDRKKMAIDPEGRPSITDWTVLARGRNVTLLDVHILTGRTHQIRVHMKSIGHPVCGDPIYGSGRGAKVPRLMLHAYTLSFTHPRTGERMTFTAPLPEEFVQGLRGNGVEWEK